MKLITLENLKNFWKDVKSYVDNGLSKKADSSHGTHVSYGTINGKEPGTPSAGTSSKVAREDHVHPVQTTVSGNAGTATKLATSRTINGTSFDGSGNITTANWGTARNIQIGNTSKSVNGSANVSWSLSEIGAAPAGYGLGTTCQDKSNQDCNNILVTGFYMGSNMTNKPSGCTQGWIYLLVMRHNDSWVRQVAYDFGTASQVYTRVKQNGNWTAWVATDTNTWRGVQDNLTSTATDQSLSANQGKVLKSLIDGKAASNHTHSYVPLANGGNITIHADSDSSSTGEYALIKAGHNELKIASSAGGTTVTKGQDKLTFNGNIVYHAGRKPTISEIGAAAASHTHNYAGSSSAGGNANAAVKLATARSINGTNFDGTGNITTANWGTARNIQIGNAVKSVNGSGNVTWNWSEMQVPRAYSSSYSFGGNQNAITTAQFITMLTDLGAFSQPHWVSRGSWSYASNQYINDTGCGNIHLAGCVVEVFGNTNAYTIKVTTPTTSSSGVTNGDFIYVNNGSNYSPGWRRLYSTAYKPTASEIGAAAASHTHNYAGSSSAGGNANAAVKLATARTINGTSFDGSANITTANWGTARNIQIGNTAKSVNGSGNVSWSLAEIGAAPSSSTSLNTTDKTIVGAINEVFQSGNSVKQNLVDTLIAKGAEDISTSNSWDSLIDIIEGSNINLAPISFNVESIPNAQYGFRLLGSGPYYESENFGIHSSYAMCKLNIVCNSNYNVYLDCINNAENNFDYGIISQINTPLSFSYQADTTGVLKSFQGQSSPEVQTVQLESKSGFYYIKYVKDSSASQGNDSLRFKVRFEKKTGGNPGVPGNPGGEEAILFSSTIGGDNRSLTGGYTHKRHTSDSYFRYDASCMDFMAYSNSTGDTLETVISENRINLTNYSRLRINGYFTTTSNDSGGAPLVGFDTIGNRDSAFAASIMIVSPEQRYYDLNISDLTGDYHLKFNVATSRGSSSEAVTKHLYITELILYP